MVDKEEEETEEEEEDSNNPEKMLLMDPWFLHTQQFRMQATHHESPIHSHHSKNNKRKSIRMLLDSKIRHMTGRDNK